MPRGMKAALPANVCAKIPDGWGFDQAAAVPLAGLTALQALRDELQLQPGQRVFISGGAGGVGTFAIQIAKWLGTDPDVLIMDEPTAGVDIGTKVEIVSIIRELADSGKGVIVISSEFPELLAVSDRVLVMRNGAIVKELKRTDIPDEESLQLAVLGV